LNKQAVEWAKASRDLITFRFLEALQGHPIHISNDTEQDKAKSIEKEYSNFEAKKILDIVHNSVIKKEFFVEEEPIDDPNNIPASNVQEEKQQENQLLLKDQKKISLWLHRKGAAPSDVGPVVIPGSRGAFSYLVQPCNNEGKRESDIWMMIR
jgi:RNA-splicing ligase RtcB